MTKCDFCGRYDPFDRRCNSYPGSDECIAAAERFLKFQCSKNNRTQTKNVNVNKQSYNKNSYGKKR